MFGVLKGLVKFRKPRKFSENRKKRSARRLSMNGKVTFSSSVFSTQGRRRAASLFCCRLKQRFQFVVAVGKCCTRKYTFKNAFQSFAPPPPPPPPPPSSCKKPRKQLLSVYGGRRKFSNFDFPPLRMGSNGLSLGEALWFKSQTWTGRHQVVPSKTCSSQSIHAVKIDFDRIFTN